MVEIADGGMPVNEISEAVGGTLLRPEGERKLVTSITTDSRTVRKDSLFVALKGERTDGHLFVRHAASEGGALCFVSRQFACGSETEMCSLNSRYGINFVIVDDPLDALQSLASRHLEGLPGVTRIGVTGSNGKTTTKEILGSILSLWKPTAVNPGNLNSEIGLPLACLRVGRSHEFAVFEMGINRVGEMDVLAGIVRPGHAAITNIGTAHIGLLGSQMGIVREKRMILRHLPRDGRAYLPGDSRFATELAEGVSAKILWHGPTVMPELDGVDDLGLDGSVIRWRGRSIRLQLVGSHNVANALCALAVAVECGVPEGVIESGIERVRPLFGRGEILRGAITVLRDCYNANTESMLRSIEFLDSVPWTGRKVLILGSMKELGDRTDTEHETVGRRVADSGARLVLFYGEESQAAFRVLKGLEGKEVRWASCYEELVAAVRESIKVGDLVLMKGSRSLAMERLTDELAAIGA